MATQLVPLPEVERLSTTVIRILAGNPGKVSPSYLALLSPSYLALLATSKTDRQRMY
jgi:hypothetical protein